MNRKRVMVVGGAGFIGQHLTHALNAEPWADPVVVGRRVQPGIPGQLRCDATDSVQIEHTLRGADFVVSLICGANAAMIEGTQNLLNAARACKVERVVLMSSMAVYAPTAGLADERAPQVTPGRDSYAAAKAECEALAARYVRDGLDVVVLRPGCVYGPGSDIWTARIGRLLQSGRLGHVGAAGQGWCNLIHVTDLARLIIKALRTPGLAGEIFNVSAPEKVSWNAYLSRFSQAIDAPLYRVGVSRLRLEGMLLAPVLKGAELIGRRLRLQPGIFPDFMSDGFLRNLSNPLQLDCRKADKIFNVPQLSLEAGVRDAAAWFKSAPQSRSHACITERPRQLVA